jgi:hypothetical protein
MDATSCSHPAANAQSESRLTNEREATMPQVDEDQQQRETYGNAPGWKDGQRVVPPMAPEPAEPDATPAPSAEPEPPVQEEASEEATPQTSQPEPEQQPYNVPPKERWDEVIQQRKEAERQRDEALQFARQILQRQQPQAPAQPATDPWEALVNNQDPAVAQQWTLLKNLVQHERKLGKQDAVQELQPVIEAGMSKLAQLDLNAFRKENPDIKPGSEEERLVTAYMEGQMDGVRHPLESAKRNALFNKLDTENRALKSKQAATPGKVAAANVEHSAGIPSRSGLPGQVRSTEEQAGEVIDKGGTAIDAAKAIFR